MSIGSGDCYYMGRGRGGGGFRAQMELGKKGYAGQCRKERVQVERGGAGGLRR